LLLILMTLTVMLASCNGGNDESDDLEDPLALLMEAAANIRSQPTFRMEIRHSGVPFRFISNMGEGQLEVTFRRAIGQYVAPDQLEADVSVIANGLTTSVLVYGRGDEQWYRLPIFGWQDADFAEGFNPAGLIAEDTGIQAAMGTLNALTYEGTESIDGVETYHLSGEADGGDVADLLVGMISDEGVVHVDVYVNIETRMPQRIVVTQPETDPEDPMTWTVDFYDIGAEPDLILPPELAEAQDS
jgi:hypothetical protein